MSENEVTLPTNEMLEMIKIHASVIQQLLNFNRELIQMINSDNQQAKSMLLELVQRKLNT